MTNCCCLIIPIQYDTYDTYTFFILFHNHQATCILIQTLEEDPVNIPRTPQGYVSVALNSGNGYDLVSNVTKEYQPGEVIMNECYSTVVGIQVSGVRNNGWIGNVTFSNGQQTDSPLECVDGCSGSTTSTAPISVDLNVNLALERFANCLNGTVCTLSIPPIAPTTASPSKSVRISCYHCSYSLVSSAFTYLTSTSFPSQPQPTSSSPTLSLVPSKFPTSSPSASPTKSPTISVCL